MAAGIIQTELEGYLHGTRRYLNRKFVYGEAQRLISLAQDQLDKNHKLIEKCQKGGATPEEIAELQEILITPTVRAINEAQEGLKL